MNHPQYRVGAEEAAAVAQVNQALNACPWKWQSDGALIRLRWNGREWHVFVPLQQIEAGVNSELVGVGCPCLEPRVGADVDYAVGFFGSLYRAAKKAVKSVSHAVIEPHRRIFKAVVPRSVYRTTSNIVNQAQGLVRQASRYATDPQVLRVAGFASAIIPGIGPAVAAGLLTAAQLAQAARTVERAGALADNAIRMGVRSPAALAASARGQQAQQLLQLIR
jgi:hypothetical protein